MLRAMSRPQRHEHPTYRHALLIGTSRVTVNAKRQNHQILGLDGAKRGYRFPAWQLDENGKPFAALPDLFDRLGDSPWAVYRFLVETVRKVGGQAAGRNGRRAQRSATAWSRSKVPFATAVRTNIICAPRGDQRICCFAPIRR